MARQKGGTAFAHLYRTARWQGVRARQLAAHPLCWRCERRGRVVAATVCNHTNGHPKGETEAMFWAGPFDSQCATCHSGDQAREEQGKGEKGCDADGWPYARQAEAGQGQQGQGDGRGAQRRPERLAGGGGGSISAASAPQTARPPQIR